MSMGPRSSSRNVSYTMGPRVSAIRAGRKGTTPWCARSSSRDLHQGVAIVTGRPDIPKLESRNIRSANDRMCSLVARFNSRLNEIVYVRWSRDLILIK